MFGSRKPPPTPEERAAAAKLRDIQLEQYCRFPDADIEAKRMSRREIVSVPDLWNLSLTYLSEGEKRSDRKSRRETGLGRAKKAKAGKKDDAPPGILRLPPTDIEDLKFYFEVFPSICGLRSNWQATVEALGECPKCGSSHELPVRRKYCATKGCGQEIGKFHTASYMHLKAEGRSSWHPSYDADMLGVVSSGSVEKANRIRDILLNMIKAGNSKDVTVLYRCYSDRNPFAMYSYFGDLAPIVEYTKPAEDGARKAGIHTRKFLEDALAHDMGGTFKARVRMSAEALLAAASTKYLKAKNAK